MNFGDWFGNVCMHMLMHIYLYIYSPNAKVRWCYTLGWSFFSIFPFFFFLTINKHFSAVFARKYKYLEFN